MQWEGKDGWSENKSGRSATHAFHCICIGKNYTFMLTNASIANKLETTCTSNTLPPYLCIYRYLKQWYQYDNFSCQVSFKRRIIRSWLRILHYRLPWRAKIQYHIARILYRFRLHVCSGNICSITVV